MFLQQVLVQSEDRFCKHPDGCVDELKFEPLELRQQTHEQLVGQRNVVAAVLPVRCELVRREVLAPQVDGVDHLSALGPQLVVLCQLLEAVTHFDAMHSAGHAQRVSDCLGADVKVPVQDRHVEQGVVCQRHGVGPIKLVEPHLDLLVRTTEPLRLAIIHLHRHTDHLKALVPHVLLGGLGFEAQIGVGVVGLKIDRQNVHQ